MPYVNVDVDIDLSEIEIDDIIEEFERRGCDYNTCGVDSDAARVLLEQIYQARKTAQPYEHQLDQLIWCVLGRI